MSGVGSRRRTRQARRSDPSGGARILLLCRTTDFPLADLGREPARRPLVVAADDAGSAAVVTELAGAGWAVAEVGSTAAGTACTRYTVRTRADAQAVVIAAVRGEAVFAQLRPDSAADPDLTAIAEDMIEDLAGIGPVMYVDAATAVHLDEDSWRLAHLIARGETLEAAARRLHLSTRTANRRLTAARQALRAESRAHLVRILTSTSRIPVAARA